MQIKHPHARRTLCDEKRNTTLHIITHHLPFFLSSSVNPSTGVFAGTSMSNAPLRGGDLVNSPEAWSREVRSSVILVGPENQPPGKKRDEVVDSSLVRPDVGETVSISAGEVALVCSSSLRGARRGKLGLSSNEQLVYRRVMEGYALGRDLLSLRLFGARERLSILRITIQYKRCFSGLLESGMKASRRSLSVDGVRGCPWSFWPLFSNLGCSSLKIDMKMSK